MTEELDPARLPLTVDGQKVGTARVTGRTDANGGLSFVVDQVELDPEHQGLAKLLEMPADMGSISIARKVERSEVSVYTEDDICSVCHALPNEPHGEGCPRRITWRGGS